MINVTAVITDRSAGWNDLVVVQRMRNTDTGTYWKGATLNTGRVLVNNAKNIECAEVRRIGDRCVPVCCLKA